MSSEPGGKLKRFTSLLRGCFKKGKKHAARPAVSEDQTIPKRWIKLPRFKDCATPYVPKRKKIIPKNDSFTKVLRKERLLANGSSTCDHPILNICLGFSDAELIYNGPKIIYRSYKKTHWDKLLENRKGLRRMIAYTLTCNDPIVDDLPASLWFRCIDPTLEVLVKLSLMKHRRTNLSKRKVNRSTVRDRRVRHGDHTREPPNFLVGPHLVLQDHLAVSPNHEVRPSRLMEFGGPVELSVHVMVEPSNRQAHRNRNRNILTRPAQDPIEIEEEEPLAYMYPNSSDSDTDSDSSDTDSSSLDSSDDDIPVPEDNFNINASTTSKADMSSAGRIMQSPAPLTSDKTSVLSSTLNHSIKSSTNSKAAMSRSRVRISNSPEPLKNGKADASSCLRRITQSAEYSSNSKAAVSHSPGGIAKTKDNALSSNSADQITKSCGPSTNGNDVALNCEGHIAISTELSTNENVAASRSTGRVNKSTELSTNILAAASSCAVRIAQYSEPSTNGQAAAPSSACRILQLGEPSTNDRVAASNSAGRILQSGEPSNSLGRITQSPEPSTDDQDSVPRCASRISRSSELLPDIMPKTCINKQRLKSYYWREETGKYYSNEVERADVTGMRSAQAYWLEYLWEMMYLRQPPDEECADDLFWNMTIESSDRRMFLTDVVANLYKVDSMEDARRKQNQAENIQTPQDETRTETQPENIEQKNSGQALSLERGDCIEISQGKSEVSLKSISESSVNEIDVILPTMPDPPEKHEHLQEEDYVICTIIPYEARVGSGTSIDSVDSVVLGNRDPFDGTYLGQRKEEEPQQPQAVVIMTDPYSPEPGHSSVKDYRNKNVIERQKDEANDELGILSLYGERI